MIRIFLAALALIAFSPTSRASARPLIADCDLVCARERLSVRAEYAQIHSWAPQTRLLGIQRISELARNTQYADVKKDAIEALGETLKSYVSTVAISALTSLQAIGPANDNESVDAVALKALSNSLESWSPDRWLPAAEMIRKVGTEARSITTKQESIRVLLDAEFMTDQNGKRKILHECAVDVLNSMK